MRARLLSVLAVVAALVLGIAAPASAHDRLVLSTPEAGESLPVPPETVVLTFSEAPLAEGANEIELLDADGTDWIVGDLDIVGPRVTAHVSPDMPEAGYRILWRVVSSDGHPISGEIPFTVGGGQPLPTEGDADAGGRDDGAADTAGDDMARLLLIGGIVVAVVVGGVAVLAAVRRKPGSRD